MRTSLLVFALAAIVAVGSTACGSAAEDQSTEDRVASQDDLVEGEEVLSIVRQDVQGGDPQLTGIVGWDMLAIRNEGREYYIFAGYDGFGKTPEHTRIEVVFEKVADGVRFTPRTPAGEPANLDKAKFESIIADVTHILEHAPESAVPFDPKTGECRKGKLSIPIKILLYTVHAITGIGCGGTALVPLVGAPSCVAFASSMILHQVMEKKAASKCQ